MTYEQTREAFVTALMTNAYINMCESSDIKNAISAIDKQIPKKIEEQTEDDREFIDYVCPNCKVTLQQKMKQAKRITIYKYKHCIDCGQALDWSDTE